VLEDICFIFVSLFSILVSHIRDSRKSTRETFCSAMNLNRIRVLTHAGIGSSLVFEGYFYDRPKQTRLCGFVTVYSLLTCIFVACSFLLSICLITYQKTKTKPAFFWVALWRCCFFGKKKKLVQRCFFHSPIPPLYPVLSVFCLGTASSFF